MTICLTTQTKKTLLSLKKINVSLNADFNHLVFIHTGLTVLNCNCSIISHASSMALGMAMSALFLT